MANDQYGYPISDHIDNMTSINLMKCWCPQVWRYRATATVSQMHTGQHAISWANNADGDNCLKDGHLMRPEKPQRDVPLSLVVVNIDAYLDSQHLCVWA